jgi:hypothetical protein
VREPVLTYPSWVAPTLGRTEEKEPAEDSPWELESTRTAA